MHPVLTRNRLAGSALFFITAIYVYWIAGDVLWTAGDEGIYLEGARRVASGQQPFRDFFAICGPLSFWMEGAIGHIFGLRLLFLRLPVILETAFLTWAVYWLVSRYASTVFSIAAAVGFLAATSRVRLLVINHRWDSSAFAMAAVLLAYSAATGGKRWLWLLAGACTGLAVCATPSMWLIGIPLAWWAGRSGRRPIILLLSGGLLIAAATALYLLQTGSLTPLIAALRWTAANYTGPNRVIYGYIPLDDAAGAGVWLQILITALPAILPPLALAGWAIHRWRQPISNRHPEIAALVAVVVALAFTAWPRWSTGTLQHTMALSWATCAILLYGLLFANLRYLLTLGLCAVATAVLLSRAGAAMSYGNIDTRMGPARATGDEADVLIALEHSVQPGDSIFAFPYLPSLYFWLDARNPTRYSFLQPGMMPREDEERVVEELKAAPPQWVIFEKWPADAVLSLWPGSDPALIPMTSLNSYIDSYYRQTDSVDGAWGHFALLRRQSPSLP